VRPLRPGQKVFIPLFVVAVALFAARNSQQDADRSQPDMLKKASFDFYLLALTLHPAFCADGHANKQECRGGQSPPIAIHGLWPERLTSGRYPRDCQGPPLDLATDLESQLALRMPGMREGLHEHEWRKHGTCSGLDDDQYFSVTLAMARRVETALGERLTTLAGARSSATDLRGFAEASAPGIGQTLTFHCRTLRDAPPAQRREAFLVEIRQCVDDDGPGGAPATLLDCARVGRRDQGCGSGFRIAGKVR
jgi:ribonuclease I